jgi:hypothetical protein
MTGHLIPACGERLAHAISGHEASRAHLCAEAEELQMLPIEPTGIIDRVAYDRRFIGEKVFEFAEPLIVCVGFVDSQQELDLLLR